MPLELTALVQQSLPDQLGTAGGWKGASCRWMPRSAPFDPACVPPGAQGQGLTTKQIGLCDSFVYIEQYGAGTASLNVAVAASIVLHHFALWAGYEERQREASGVGCLPAGGRDTAMGRTCSVHDLTAPSRMPVRTQGGLPRPRLRARKL